MPLNNRKLNSARSVPSRLPGVLALPISACWLLLDDEAVSIAVALRLDSELGSPYTCGCGSLVEAGGPHGFVCKKAPSRVLRHHALNDCISHAFSAAGIPARKEQAGLALKDGSAPFLSVAANIGLGMSRVAPQ